MGSTKDDSSHDERKLKRAIHSLENKLETATCSLI